MKAFLIYLVFNVFAFCFGAISFNYQFIGIGILSFTCSLYLFYTYPNKKLIELLLPLSFLIPFGGYSIWESKFMIFPMWIIALSGSYFSLVFYLYIKNQKQLFTASIFYCLLIFVSGYTIFPAWKSTYDNFISIQRSYLSNSNSIPILNATYFDPVNGNDIALPIGKKRILIDLWETSCAPCIAGIPDFEKLMINNTDTGLVIYSCLAPSNYDNPAFIQKVLKDRKGNFIMCRDSSILNNLHISGVPTFLLIDRDGAVLYNGYTSFDLSYLDNIYKVIKRFQ